MSPNCTVLCSGVTTTHTSLPPPASSRKFGGLFRFFSGHLGFGPLGAQRFFDLPQTCRLRLRELDGAFQICNSFTIGNLAQKRVLLGFFGTR